MAGGIWTTQDKVRPGGYVNFKNGSIEDIDLSSGVMTIPLELGYGPEQTIVPVTKTANLSQFGYDLKHESMLLLREALKSAKVVLVYRLNKGEVASATVGGSTPPPTEEGQEGGETRTANLSIKAKFSGEFGNEISLVSKQNVDDPTKFIIDTYVSGKLVDSQTADTVENLKVSNYVDFEGTGELSEFTVTLSGGTNGAVTAGDYAGYFEAVQVYDFSYMALPVTDPVIKTAAVSFIKRLRDEEGQKCQLVVPGEDADHEAVINVKNGVKLKDGTVIGRDKATAWIAGASAVCPLNQSLTYTAYPDSIDVDERLTSKETEEAIRRGEFVFTQVRGEARVEADINSLHTFTDDKKNVWAKNEAVRTFDYIANDSKKTFEDFFIGKVPNDVNGREAFRANRIVFFDKLQADGAIQNFDKDSVQVEAGEQPDGMVLIADVQKLNTLEKLYMTVTVK